MTASIEAETIQAFVIATKRDRYADLISKPKHRKELLTKLAHFRDFEPRYIVQIPRSEQSPVKIARMLIDRGSPATCHVISEWSKLDGCDLDLKAVLNEVVGIGMGTLLCCISARLAYFESEDDRHILENLSRKQEPA